MVSSFARKLFAASWFATFGFVASGTFFFRTNIKFPALFLYLIVPTFASAMAGYIWGSLILDATKSMTAAGSMLRGMLVAAGSFLIFAVLYAFGLPIVEHGWAMKEIGGILVMALTFGILMVGPWILITGMIAGISLYKFGRRAANEHRR